MQELPGHVDPGGEHDEFHTFVEWLPGWRHKVGVLSGRRIERHGLVIADLEWDHGAAELQQWFSGDPSGRLSPDPFDYFQRLQRVRTFVAENLSGDLRVARVARVAGLAPSSFRRYFRKQTRLTFGAWLTQRRIERAVHMLHESDAKISEIASAVGYAESRSFRRAFRRHVGRSPTEYRQAYLTGRLRESQRKR